jgi:thiol-disulfide isomerase/thioredoxin
LVVLNFWATWCACREMPHLSELQDELGSADFEVVTVATGTNQRPMERFLARNRRRKSALHTDNNSALARDMGGRWPACDDYFERRVLRLAA